MSDPVLLGTIRKDASDLAMLFEAVRVAEALGHGVTVNSGEEPIPPPVGEEREWDKRRREENSGVIYFWAENGEAR